MKKIIALLCIALMLVPIAALAEQERIETGFSSPEEAFKAYFEAFRKNDVNAMLSTFAVETYVENVDAYKQCERLGFGMPYNDCTTIPVTNDYIKELLIMNRLNRLSTYMYTQYILYSWYMGGANEDYDPYVVIPTTESGKIDEYLNVYSGNGFPEAMQEAEFIRFVDMQELFEDAGYVVKGIEIALRTYDADAVNFVAAIVEIEGAKYLMCMDCAEYDGKWYNVSMSGKLNSLFGALSYGGGLIPLDEIGMGDISF